ncbi:MAG: AzlC family ABC transporter permease [Clostridia bacterium]|nr:AzlC family ABC transporter permease [Clostridia bacterium]
MRASIKKALYAAFPHTLPVLAGFGFLGLTYGVYMRTAGFSPWFPFGMSATVFAGSMQFVATDLLLGAFQPLQVLLMTLLVNARHLFYGISMLDRYRGMGWKKPYLIFGMCDETFSINCATEVPLGVDRGWFYFFVTLLDQFYWVAGATLGGLFGGLLPFSAEGLEFSMTALFVVIFIDQWRKEKQHLSHLLGVGLSLLCLILWGKGDFLLPAMAAILLSLTLIRPLFKEGDQCK